MKTTDLYWNFCSQSVGKYALWQSLVFKSITASTSILVIMDPYTSSVAVFIMFVACCDSIVSGMQRPMGLLSLLDEESRFPRANDLSLAGKDI